MKNLLFPFSKRKVVGVLAFALIASTLGVASEYNHFKASVYTRAYEVQKMKDPEWMESTWKTISSQLKVDKIYLETHRDLLVVDEDTLQAAKAFFSSKGLEVAAGITFTIDESNLFETYCYSNPEHLEKAKEVIELSATYFDEVILDDFFFTSCKCELCIEGKGELSWTEYRLKILKEAAEKWILAPAKAVNPDVKVIIKYPNWYEHFQGLGFDLENGPRLFDGIYTGTETRDAVLSNQHLQGYHGFLIQRYFTHLAPGRNGGGWVDPFGSTTVDRYAEQLWMTLLGKAPEMTLFDYRMMIAPMDRISRAPWQTEASIWDYQSYNPKDQARAEDSLPTYARAAGYALESIDPYLEKLGEPVALSCYKPFHSKGDDFLQSYIGMIGVPVNLVSDFSYDEDMLLLTASAAHDPEIVSKIEKRLRTGKDVVITSGLLRKLQGNGIENIAELGMSDRKASGEDFLIYRGKVSGEKRICFSQLDYLTNDSWPVVEVLDGQQGWPIYHFAQYADARLWVWVIPDQFADLYELPEPVLNTLREQLGKSLGLWIEGPSRVALFLYDNQTVVVHNFRDEPVEIALNTENRSMLLRDAMTGEELSFEAIEVQQHRQDRERKDRLRFSTRLPAHGFRVLEW